MGLEDANIFGKDIYALIVDFTSAFNTTDHDRMLWIMYDLGFPTDAIDTVKDLYENATTQVRLSSGASTNCIHFERGTIGNPFLLQNSIQNSQVLSPRTCTGSRTQL